MILRHRKTLRQFNQDEELSEFIDKLGEVLACVGIFVAGIVIFSLGVI